MSSIRSSRPLRQAITSTTALVSLLVILGGCTFHPVPLSDSENLARVEQDLKVVMSPQEPIAAPITMDEAMARALKYNLDARVKLAEMAIANEQLDLSRFDMLPKIVADAGYLSRSNDAGSQSLNLDSGLRSPLSSTSTDRDVHTADLGTTWNILDFGVSYLRARQNGNLSLVADEHRRRAVQGIMQDVRTAYWRAVAAERLLQRIEPLEKRVQLARSNAGALEHQRVQNPLEALTYQRTLVDTLRQLQSLRRELSVAKSQLAALMGLPPGQDFSIAIPGTIGPNDVPVIKTSAVALESYALLNRPELREEAYNARITADEARKSLLKMLPGIDVNAALRYDSNSFLVNQRWADYGARVSWNLLSLATLPDTLALNKAQKELVAFRRQALSVAVLSQVHVSLAQYKELSDEFRLASEQAGIEARIEDAYHKAGSVGQTGAQGVIQAEVSAVVSDLRRDLAYAELQNAYAKVMVSAGIDPLPAAIPANDLASVRQAVVEGLQQWQDKAVAVAHLSDLEPLAPAAPAEPSPAPEAKPVVTQ